MNRSPLKPGKGFKPRQTPIRRGKARLARAPFRRDASDNYGGILRGAKLKAVGKTGRKNRRALDVFKRECARAGVDGRCEVRRGDCFGEATTWAHGRRRRNLKPGELEKFAVAACVPCHRWLDEVLSRGECAAEVSRLIALRPERYLEAA